MKSLAAIIKISIILFGFLLSASHVAADTANPLTGTFYGTATITSPADIATIDLAFYLDVSGTAISHGTSYIDLDKTLVFPAVAPQISGKDVGPRVAGTLRLTEFNLQTDDFTSTIGDKTVTRKVTLTGTSVKDAGNSLSGIYTETINGMGPDVVTMSGTFILVKPAVAAVAEIADLNGDNCLDIAEITAGGDDPDVLEYGDVSYALHLYNNPSESPALCNPGQDLMKQILTQYYGTLK